jgi:serine/threonine protein kinase
VALKVIPKQSIKNKDARAKIEKEVKILKTINNHDNIIRLFEVFEDRSHVYLVFELLEKGDLVNFFRENTLLEEPELKVFFREIGTK